MLFVFVFILVVRFTTRLRIRRVCVSSFVVYVTTIEGHELNLTRSAEMFLEI